MKAIINLMVNDGNGDRNIAKKKLLISPSYKLITEVIGKHHIFHN